MQRVSYVEGEGEAEGNRDEESSNHNRNVSRVVAVEDVSRL